MSPPAPAPDHRPHLDLRTAVIAVLIGALTLGGVVGGGLLAAGDTNYAQPPTTDRTRSPTPSDSWASGSTQQWSTAIDPGASIFTSPDHLFSVKTDGENTQSSTLTAYTMNDSGPSAAWTATVDTTGDSVATNGAKNNPTIYPAFLTWGKNTLIHGTTLYDITTGDTTDAPWPTDAVPVVAGDTVIACQKTTCAGYREGDTTPAWSSAVNDPVKSLLTNSETDIAAGIINDAHNYATVYTRVDAKYAIIAHHYVFNIDTGEFINFSVPEENPAVYAVTSTTEGWAISSAHSDVLSGTSDEWHMSFYDIDGGKPKSTEIQRSFGDNTRVLRLPSPRTAEDLKKIWVRGDLSAAAGTMPTVGATGEPHCGQSISMTEGATIDLTGFDKNVFPCFNDETTQVSDSAKVVMVGTAQMTNKTPFSLMFDSATGERIAFEGLDPDNGAVFDVAAPKQIIGYSPADGTLIGYKPANG